MGRKARDKKSRPGPVASSVSLPDAEPAAPPSPRRDRPAPPRSPAAFAWAAVLAAATAATYAGSLATPFLLDDPINITKNPLIQKPLGLGSLLGDPRATVTASLRWNYLAGGFEVGGYHVLNIVAHIATGLLVFALARTALAGPTTEQGRGSRATGLAGVAALVFLLHPMQTESVTYVIQRAEVFAAAALVGCLLALARMKESLRGGDLAMLAVACVFGTYSKPSFAVAPALMLVYDACFLSRLRVAELAKRWPAYAIATAAAVATFALARAGGGFESDTAGFDMEGITPLSYLSAQFGVVVHYLRVALWPARLCFDCGYRGAWPVVSSFLGESVLMPAAILATLAVAGAACWKRLPVVTFAVFGSAVALAPSSSFVPLADFYVEHRMYLPIAFLAMALVALADRGIAIASSALPSRAGSARPSRAASALKLTAAVVVAGALALTTVARNRLLADPIALMEDALAQAPRNERVQYNLANAYKRDGRLEDAIPHYEAAIRIAPGVIRSYQNLGSLYLEKGELEKALEIFAAGTKAKPGVGMAWRNLATTLLRLGRPEEALDAAQKSLELEPGNANGQRLLREARAGLGSGPGQ